MNRSRSVLVLVLGLVAVGVLTEALWPTSSLESSEESEAASLAFREGGETGIDGEAGTDGESRDAGRAAPGLGSVAEAEGYGNEPLWPAPDRDPLLDNPADWAEAGVVLESTAFVATVTGPGVVSTTEPEPGPIQHWFPNPTQFGGDRVFIVVDQTSSADYVKVSLPVMPNGQEGWILRSEVEITEIQHRALIDLSAHSVTVWDGDNVVVETTAVIGKPETPTPLGVFYVRDIVAQDDPTGGFGPFVLALSGFSEVLETFQGGLPALAIHGTDTPSQLGTGQSAGCVRIPNDLITILAETVPLGTPVTVIA